MAGLMTNNETIGLPENSPDATFMDKLKWVKNKVMKDSVLESGFMDGFNNPEFNMSQPLTHNIGTFLRGLFEPIDAIGGGAIKALKGELTQADAERAVQSMTFDVGVPITAARGLMGNVSPNVASMFVSPSHKEIKAAEKMLKAGVPREKIHAELLMHKKPDGFWRKEIDDSGMILDPSSLKVKYPEYPNFEMSTVGDVVKHPELYKEAATLKDLHFQLGQDIPGNYDRGSMVDNILTVYQDSPQKRIAASKKWIGKQSDEEMNIWAKEAVEDGDAPDIETALKWFGESKQKDIDRLNSIGKFEDFVPGTVSHELQHAVQEKEGWARGGSPEEFSQQKDFHREQAKTMQDALLVKQTASEEKISIDDAVKLLQKEGYDLDTRAGYYADTMSEKNIFNTMREHDAIVTTDPYDQYKNLLGEREARDTASRMNLSLDERRGLMPDLGENAILKGVSGHVY